jgi:hypothetical protein
MGMNHNLGIRKLINVCMIILPILMEISEGLRRYVITILLVKCLVMMNAIQVELIRGILEFGV